MKIQKLIFQNSFHFEHHVQNKGFDFVMEIETSDISYNKEKIVNLGILTREHNLSFEILKEIFDFFDDLNDNEKLEIDEVVFRIHSDNIGFNYIRDIWDHYLGFEEELSYRNNLAKKLHIKSIHISLPESTKSCSLSHIGFIADKLTISVNGKNNIDSITTAGFSELYIDGAGNNINEIRIGGLKEKQKIFINSVQSNEVSILNLGYPFGIKKIKYLEILNSQITKIELRGFEEAKVSIEETKIWSTIINGGMIENIVFNKISLVDSRITNTGLIDLLFPKKNTDFLIKNSKLEKNSYSNIDWGNYFSEYDLSKYEKEGKKLEKRWYITKGGLKETYRMLKYEHDQIGNKTEANKFFAKEMEYYRKSLLENYTWRTFFDSGIGQKRIICWYNQLTNDFGNSWIRPLLWMGVIVGIATLYKYLESDGNIDITDTIRSNILPISEIGKFDSWLSFFYQIAWAALIYQFVVALRRISQR